MILAVLSIAQARRSSPSSERRLQPALRRRRMFDSRCGDRAKRAGPEFPVTLDSASESGLPSTRRLAGEGAALLSLPERQSGPGVHSRRGAGLAFHPMAGNAYITWDR